MKEPQAQKRAREQLEADESRTYSELVADAESMDPRTDPGAITALVQEAAWLDPVSKRKVQETIRKATGTPFTVMREAEKGGSDHDNDEPDHLALAQRVRDVVGAEDLIGDPAFTWRYKPERGIWRPLEPRAERQLVQQTLAGHSEGVPKITKSLVDGVTDLFRSEVYRDDHEWDQGDADAVSTPNGLLELAGGSWQLRPHRREDYRTVQIPVAYDSEAEATRFRRFLREIFDGDEDPEAKGQAILEMMGYTLMAHARHEGFVILVGEGSNGKSVLLSVLEALVGSENTAGVQPAQFDRGFQRAHLHLKLANIVTEVRQGEVIADAELKGITSGEPTTVEHKFKPPFMLRPYATCWFGTNHLPHTRDFSFALFRRALVVPFNRRFEEEDADPGLKGRLLEELPGVLNLALGAYAKAILTGSFTEPKDCAEAKHGWRLEADQAAEFVADCCGEGGITGSSDMFAAYLGWAAEQGIRQTLKQKSLSERLTKLGYQKARNNEGRSVFHGLHLRPEAAALAAGR